MGNCLYCAAEFCDWVEDRNGTRTLINNKNCPNCGYNMEEQHKFPEKACAGIFVGGV